MPLHLWDRNGHLGLAVKLDFAKDVAPLVRWAHKVLSNLFIFEEKVNICPGSCQTWGCRLT